MDYQRELNKGQHQAVTTIDGPLLVIAGAGTGKTRTLVYRVARLVEMRVDPRSILLLTFTRRAAEEMLRRASLLMDNRCEKVAGGTFHSFANIVLRQYGRNIALPAAFTIMDRPDNEDVIRHIRTEMGLNSKERRFPRKQTIAEIYSMAVNKQWNLSQLIERDYPHLNNSLEDLLRLYERYVEYKKERALLDYDDLLIELKDLLAGPGGSAVAGCQNRPLGSHYYPVVAVE
ncbi:MAG: UvrD-helicase domain-containing protein, partial [Deltaproteobacteria bacterium]|nr:UvrD-helicase domain-containing protein [Deltaproteobacteria bacterium]